MSAKFSFQKGKPHVTLNIHPRIPMQKASALTKALAAVLMAASVLLTGCAPACGSDSPSLPQSQAVILRLAETMPENHPSARAMAYFAEMVSRETQGRVTVKIYYNGSLGTPTEIIEQVKFGGIAMARVNVLELSEEVESIRKFFVPSNFAGGDAQIEWVRNNEETLRDECQMDRITPLVWYYPDFRCFYGTDCTFLDKKDLEGKKIESSESALMAEIFRDMGIELAGSVNTNTYKSLISGNIDGAESSFSEFICNNYDQYIHFVTKNDAWCLPDVMIINTENLTSSPKRTGRPWKSVHKAHTNTRNRAWSNSIRFGWKRLPRNRRLDSAKERSDEETKILVETVLFFSGCPNQCSAASDADTVPLIFHIQPLSV